MKQLGCCLEDALVAVVVIWLVGAFVRVARAEEQPPLYVMSPAEVRELADFASSALRAPKLTDLPVPVRSIDPDLLKRFCNCKPVGLVIQGMLYIAPEIDLSTVKGKSVVLHELAHALQNARHGPISGCTEVAARDEAEAIQIQNEWLYEQASGYRGLFVARRCFP